MCDISNFAFALQRLLLYCYIVESSDSCSFVTFLKSHAKAQVNFFQLYTSTTKLRVVLQMFSSISMFRNLTEALSLAFVQNVKNKRKT